MKISLKIYFQACIVTITLLMASCEKKVIDILPTDRLLEDQAYNNASRIEANVVGTYEALQSIDYLSGRALIYADILGEDVADINGFFGDIPRYTTLSSNGIAYNVWQAGYAAIGRSNIVIEKVQATTNIVGATLVNQYVSEAKYVRAISNFYLVNFYAQPYVYTPDASHPGIPLILQAFTTNDPSANQPRSTVAKVYAQIIKDLTEALPNLPLSYSTAYSSKTRATKAAAAALLSRVCLYMGDYANAKTYAGDIITGKYGTYALEASPVTVFRNYYANTESIFSIPNNAADNPAINNALPMHYWETGRGDLVVTPTFLNAATNPYFANDDKRRTELIAKGTVTGNTRYYFSKKYIDVSTRADWAPIIRYAEVLLTYAEAGARLEGGVDDAITRLNEVRNRSRLSAPVYTAASFASKDALINAVLGERRIELAFEGHRIFDLQRTKRGVSNKYDSDVSSILPVQAFGSAKLIFPIPDAEVKKSNNVLKQNSGY